MFEIEPEVWLTAATCLVLLGYHGVLMWRVRYTPLRTVIGLTNHTRQLWVESVMADKRDILAVQTLRNWTMAASLLASTAILVGLGLLSLAADPDTFQKLAHTLSLATPDSAAWWETKVLVLVLNFFIAFFNFSLAIRSFNHVTFMINVPLTPDSPTTAEAVTKTLNRAALHYTFGMRGYYLAIPFTLWLFGPAWMLAGAGVLVLVLAKIDLPV